MLIALFYANGLFETVTKIPSLIVLFTLPAIVDWLFQVFGVSESTSIRRLSTGVLVGQAYLVLLDAIVGFRLSLLGYFLVAFAAYGVFLYLLFRKTRVMSSYMSSSWP